MKKLVLFGIIKKRAEGNVFKVSVDPILKGDDCLTCGNDPLVCGAVGSADENGCGYWTPKKDKKSIDKE